MSSKCLSSPGTRSSLEKFLERLGLAPRVQEPLSRHCTWRIGGPADILVEPASWREVASLVRCSHENGIPAVIIGKGSNLLFDDEGLRGVAIKIGRKLAGLSIDGETVHAGAGVSAPRLARAAGLAGLSGLEHIVGIPGTLGGLIVMNGGSRRKTIGEVITEVKAMDREGTARVFSHEDCAFAYRRSRFHNDDLVVMEATLKLAAGRRDSIMAEMLAILRERRRKFPLNLPNCGSVFKSVPEIYDRLGSPGKIIEDLGLKGLRIGDAMIDTRHANFIVNVGSAAATDVLELVRIVRQAAHRKFGIHPACEVRYVDPQGRMRTLESKLEHEIP